MSFDFIEKNIKIYHNDKELDCKELKVDKVWIGLSLRRKGNHIEMVEYKYE